LMGEGWGEGDHCRLINSQSSGGNRLWQVK
jgi:hypothetical protein